MSDATNFLSTQDNPEVDDPKLNNGYETGCLTGPFHKLPFHPLRVPPSGVSSPKPTSKMLLGLLPFISRIMVRLVSIGRVYMTMTVA